MMTVNNIGAGEHGGTAALLPLHRSGDVLSTGFHAQDLPERSAASLSAGGAEAELREKFTQFVGEAFYGQMLKAMRSTVAKPAYFHGGRAEEAFQGQLDQKMSEELTKASASKFAEPMFARQFPRFAHVQSQADLDQLAGLSRR